MHAQCSEYVMFTIYVRYATIYYKAIYKAFIMFGTILAVRIVLLNIKCRKMRTVTKKTILILALALALPAYIFASSGLSIAYGNVKTKKACMSSSTLTYENAILINFNFEDEEYINDIPFNDNSLTNAVDYKKAIAVDYEFEEELYIDDIPLDTHESVL
jgi:hypothetical protein